LRAFSGQNIDLLTRYFLKFTANPFQGKPSRRIGFGRDKVYKGRVWIRIGFKPYPRDIGGHDDPCMRKISGVLSLG
jgi:hypothetical protein